MEIPYFLNIWPKWILEIIKTDFFFLKKHNGSSEHTKEFAFQQISQDIWKYLLIIGSTTYHNVQTVSVRKENKISGHIYSKY